MLYCSPVRGPRHGLLLWPTTLTRASLALDRTPILTLTLTLALALALALTLTLSLALGRTAAMIAVLHMAGSKACHSKYGHSKYSR